MKILITGVAGAIGSHLGERLLDLGHEVVGIDALTNYYSPQIKKINVKEVEDKGAKILFKDLVTDDLEEIANSIDVIFHLAAQPGISAITPFESYLNNNIIATKNLLDVAKKNKKLKLFVNISTSSVYGAHANGDEKTEPKPTSYYGVTKLAAEQLVLAQSREDGFPACSLRLFSVYGERERPEKFFHRLIKSIAEDESINMYEGSEKHIRSYSYISDVIDAFILVLDNGNKVLGEIINVGNSKTSTTGEGLGYVEKIMGKKAKIKTSPPRSGDQIETAANIEKAKKILNFEPKINLEEGLKAEVEWYLDKIHGKVKS